jgi:hypothetical protein
MTDRKNLLKEHSILSAGVNGYEHYPRRDRCFYDAGREPAEHAAYWNGWDKRANEVDREQDLHGTARNL